MDNNLILVQFLLGNIFLIISIILITKVILKVKLNRKSIIILIPLFIISTLSSYLPLLFYILIILLLVLIAFILLKQIILVEKCELLEEYIKKSSELTEKYASSNHKYTNSLITIKSYIKSNKNNALKYIDSLLDYNPKKSNWLVKLNYIKENSVRYLIYYKISKAEDSNLKVSVEISKDIKDVESLNLDVHELSMLSEVIGEYFDNAIYASLESKEKELHFSCYLDNNSLVFLIANTYKDKIDLDLIEQKDYTTKGQKHGRGLYDINKSLKDNNKLDYSYEVIDNYFVAKLAVKLD